MNKASLDYIIKKYEVLPVGNGYIDLITRKENIAPFINALNELKIKIVGMTLWDFVNEDRKSFGLGGPINPYGTGWFSEICDFYYDISGIDDITQNNNMYLKYIMEDIKKENPYYRECFVPAFCLDVLDTWTNTF